MSNTLHPNHSTLDPASECDCHARAFAYLAELIGEQPADLTWDGTHRLQGHVHVGHREFVVIANRDASHEPVVLAAPSWDAVRRSTADERRGLIPSCAITDHDRFVAVLAAEEFAAPVLVAA